jgi:hypothetical protein
MRHIKYFCKFNPSRIKAKRINCPHCVNDFASKAALITHLSKFCKNKPKLKLQNNKITKLEPIISKHIVTRLKKRITLCPKLAKIEPEIHESCESSDDEVFVSDTGNSILDRIIDKMGKEIGLDFLIGNFLTKKYDKIIEKAYLENIGSDNYPFVCKGRSHFRYYNKNGELVDDIDGNMLSKTIHRGIQNAGLTSSIIIIKKHLENNNDNDELYDSYDLAQLQGIAYKMTTNKSLNKIKKYLSTRVLNPNHPYFRSHSSINVNGRRQNPLIF